PAPPPEAYPLSLHDALPISTVAQHPVRSRLLDVAEEGGVGHIELADWPELVVVAPGTADLLARAAHGLAGDLVSCVLLATLAPIDRKSTRLNSSHVKISYAV